MLPALLILLCVVLRVVPHPPNFAPVGATAVFAGRTLPRAWAIGLTWVAMFIGDVVLSWAQGFPLLRVDMPFVYGGFAVQALLGHALRRMRGGSIAAAVLGASAFFALSNFGVWLSGMYGRTLPGLVNCYAMAIPFFRATLAGDVLWTIGLALLYSRLAPRLGSRGSRWVPTRAADLRSL